MNDRRENLENVRSLARGALAQQDFTTAAALFRRAVTLDPRSAEDWYELAIASYKIDDTLEGHDCLRKAVSLQPKNAHWLFMYANSLSNRGSHAQALATHRRAITAGLAEPAAAWIEIARIHERMRQPKQARQAVEKALQLRPGSWAALDVLGHLAQEDSDFDQAHQWFAKALDAARDPLDKATVAHSLGGVYEKRKLWDEAFAAHERANRIKATSPLARGMLRGDLPDYQLAFADDDAAEYYRRWGERTFDDGLPTPCFLVGFPRSGTTMTEQVLAALPNVRTTDEHAFMTPAITRAMTMIAKLSDRPEGHFERLDRLTPGQITELRTAYWNAVWRVVGPEAREKRPKIIDKHPLRILDVGMINLLFPRAKIIVLIRDPRDCCVSCFFQNLGLTPVAARFMKLDTLGEIYATIMGFWVRIREMLTVDHLEIRYEDLVSDFEPNARRLVEFVGEEWSDDVLRFHEKAARRAINTPSYQAVTQKVNTRAVGKWSRYESHLGPLLPHLRPFIQTFGYEL